MMFYSDIDFILEDFLDYFFVNLWNIFGLILYYFYFRFMGDFLDNVFDDFLGLLRLLGLFCLFLDFVFLEPTIEEIP